MSRIDEIKKIDIVSYLQSQGHEVHHHQGNKAWFWSPIREESGKPSFVVFTNDNKWKDYGSSLPRGDIIDLVQEIERCSTSEAMDIIEQKKGISCHKPTEAISSPVLLLKSVSDAYTDDRLITYLRSRNIPSWAYEKYTKQVEYYFRDTPDKVYTAVGFQNDSGGWEMRNSIHKYATSPKDVTTFGGGYEQLNICEGFFTFLSILSMYGTKQLKGTTIVLNGLGLLFRILPTINQYKVINNYLDLGAAADKHTEMIRARNPNIIDHRYFITKGTDFNDLIK